MPSAGGLSVFVFFSIVLGAFALLLALLCALLYVRGRRTLRRLAESEERFRVLCEQSGVGLALLSADGHIVQANPALERMLGFDPGRLRGLLLSDLSHPEDRSDETRRMRQPPASPAADHVEREKRYLRKDGGVVWARVVRVAVRDHSGQVRYHASVLIDMTERRRLEEQARRAQKLETLATLVGGIAHDFNNQLTAVIGNLGLALEDLGAAGESGPPLDQNALRSLRSSAGAAEEAARRCAAMTARLLTFSHGRTGDRGPLRLEQLLPEAARLLRSELPPSVRVEVRVPDHVRPVQGDWGQLHQVIHTLALNARDAMPDGGVLTLALADRDVGPGECAADREKRPGHFVELLVQDDGGGMTPEVRARLFEPFFTTKPGGQGGGLGLSEVYGIVKGHQGRIEVHSAPGQGSAFRLYLPAATGVAPAPAPAPEDATGDECILVADDEEMVRELARLVLERRGYRVLTASDGDEALAQYAAHPGGIDLVLLDYSMPGMNGLQVFEELRKTDARVRVLFSSGYGLGGDASPLTAAGARGFVAKPYRPDELTAAVRKALE